MKAYVFPGQGSQFVGMGKDLYDSIPAAKSLFEQANDLLGFKITDIMFTGSDDDLKQTKVTQPAVFLHSVILAKSLPDFKPSMVAGHSLGELSALVAAEALEFEAGLKLVAARAMAMQKACEENPSTMAAILGLEDQIVEGICESITGTVVAANYNCPGQLVISGSNEAVKEACEKMTEAGAKRALMLPVGGAFHSPLMAPAGEELSSAINNTAIKSPICPIYQNVTAQPVNDPDRIKDNLKAQLTAPVRWTQIMQNMITDGCAEAVEVGPGRALQGMFKKIDRKFAVNSAAI
ncbi:ACP S-malonyltransferase [Flavobacteriales bacterium]|nr:ACP S-malonyltransferase [Flavobacteriales bacterium]MDC3336526.1 ACP S-malonyltransferase [Flavobacteriales bacterium]